MDMTSMKNQDLEDTPLTSSDKKLDNPALSEYAPTPQQSIKNFANLGQLEKPDLSGRVKGCCGGSIQIEICLDGDVIQDARFQTDGCSATIACSGMITRMIKGKTLSEALKLEPDTLRKVLGGLPQSHQHCANLAVNTLRTVILKQTAEDTLNTIILPNSQDNNQ